MNSEATALYSLHRQNSAYPGAFESFDYFRKQIIFGRLKVLKYFRLHPVLLGGGNQSVAGALFFESLDPKRHPYHSVGQVILADAGDGLGHVTSARHLSEKIRRLQSQVEPLPIYGPINGHINLGVGLPHVGAGHSDISFLTGQFSRGSEKFFAAENGWQLRRSLFALQTALTPALIDRIKKELESRPPEVNVRCASRTTLKRDVKSMWRITRCAMDQHPLYVPLEFDEEWQLLRNLYLLLDHGLLQFLTYRGQDIGYCFAVKDYNQVLSPKRSDAANVLRLLQMGRSINRGRIIYSCQLPEYQGRRWFKYVRHSVLLRFWQLGIREVESSYIDEGNFRSRQNAQSTGAKINHEFQVFQLAESGRDLSNPFHQTLTPP